MRRLGLALSIFVALSASANSAGSPDFNKVLQESQPYIEQRQYDRAETILKRGYDAYVRAGKAEDIGALELRNNLAAVYYFDGKADKAIAEYDAVRKIREQKLGLHHEHTRGAYQSLARIFIDINQPKKAQELLSSFATKTESEPSPNYSDLFWALEWIRDIEQDNHQFDDALATSQRLRDDFLKSNPDQSDSRYLRYVLNASAIYAVLGRLDESLAVINKALAEAKPTAANIDTLTKLRLNVSTIKLAKNDNAAALDTLQAGLREIAKLGAIKSEPAAELISGIGAIYVSRGELRSAETYIDRALEVLTTAFNGTDKLPQDDPAFAKTYSLLGVVLAGDNQKDASLAALQFAFNQYSALIARPDDDWTAVGIRYAKALTQFGFIKEANKLVADMQRSFPADVKDADVNSIRLLIERCSLSRAKGEMNAALKQCQQAEQLQAAAGTLTFPERLGLSLELALTYQSDQARRVSMGPIRELISNPKQDRSFRNLYKPLLTIALDTLPKNQVLAGDDAVQADSMFKAIQILRHNPTEDNAERVKRLHRMLNQSALHDALRQEYLNARLDRANDRLLKLALSSDDFQDKNAGIRSALLSEVALVSGQIEALGSKASRAESDKSAGDNDDTTSLHQVQDNLEPTEALIFYQVFASRSYAFVIRRDSVVMKEIGMNLERMSALVADIRPGDNAPFLEPQARGNDPLKGFNPTSAYSLYQAIWPEAALTGVSSIFIVPDGPLTRVAFPTLLTKAVEKPTTLDQVRAMPWLLKTHLNLNFIPTAALLLDRKASSVLSAPFFVGVGDPVPAQCAVANALVKSATSDAIDPNSLCKIGRLADAADEIRKVAAGFPLNSQMVKLGTDATEAQVRQLDAAGVLRKATLLLFATHGLAPGELDQLNDLMRLYNTDTVGVPAVGKSVEQFMQTNTKMTKAEIKELNGSLMMSFFKRDVPDVRFRFPPGLVLSADSTGPTGDSSRDGFLSSAEIGLLELNADLVILSACNTAAESGEFEQSTFSGLTEAFLSTGARGMVVSHWSVVSSAARELTLRLVNYLREHKETSPAIAVREAADGLLKSGDDPHPFVWGPFFYVGSGAHVSL